MRWSANNLKAYLSVAGVLIASAVSLASAPGSEAASPQAACHEQAGRMLCHATPDGGPGYLRDQKIDTAAKLEDILVDLDSMPNEMDVEIQLLTTTSPDTLTTYRHKPNDGEQRSYVIDGFRGSPEHRLIIRGIADNGQWLTQFKGKPLDEITGPSTFALLSTLDAEELPTAPANAGDLNDFLAGLADKAPETIFTLMQTGKAASYPLFCLEIRKSKFIILQYLAFDDCWLSAVHASEVRHLSVLDSQFVGSRDAIFATATSDPDKARFYQIARNSWTSDLGADIWRTVPWGATHDGVYATRNGSLFASRNIAGSVKFHDNTIRHTYNGIRLVARTKDGCNDACVKRTNKNVEIYNNRFEFVRDNPVEPEGRAEQWAIFHNEFYNSYAPISMDGVRDGPIYVWGNRAWYDEVPGALCVDGPHWADGKVYVFNPDPPNPPGWATVDPANEYDPYCATHRQGRIFKLGPLARSPKESLPRSVEELPGLYVFHNSWFVRSPLFAGGVLNTLRHWNNAIFFASCTSTGGEDCRVMDVATEQPYGIYPTPDGQALYYNLFSIYDPAKFHDKSLSLSDKRLPYSSHHNISNRGFPKIGWLDRPEDGSKPLDPMFIDPGHGNFTLDSKSPALRAACRIDNKDIKKVECASFGQQRASDIGAVQSDPLFGNPLFNFKSPVPDESKEYPDPAH